MAKRNTHNQKLWLDEMFRYKSNLNKLKKLGQVPKVTISTPSRITQKQLTMIRKVNDEYERTIKDLKSASISYNRPNRSDDTATGRKRTHPSLLIPQGKHKGNISNLNRKGNISNLNRGGRPKGSKNKTTNRVSTSNETFTGVQGIMYDELLDRLNKASFSYNSPNSYVITEFINNIIDLIGIERFMEAFNNAEFNGVVLTNHILYDSQDKQGVSDYLSQLIDFMPDDVKEILKEEYNSAQLEGQVGTTTELLGVGDGFNKASNKTDYDKLKSEYRSTMKQSSHK